MDPVTLAILSAIGVEAVKTTYKALVERIRKSKGAEADELIAEIHRLETNPSSQARRAVVAEEITRTGIADDAELVALAQQLLSQIKALPNGEQRIEQTVSGNYNAVAADASHAEVHVNDRPRD
jgi:hypothetical protein